MTIKTLFAVSVAATLGSFIAVRSQAATLNVNTTAQCAGAPCSGDDGEAGCSFGEAILAINQAQNIGECVNAAPEDYGVNDTIHLPAGGTLTFDRADLASDDGPNALPVIYRSVAIHGHGATLRRVDHEEGRTFFRFFQIGYGTSGDIFLAWNDTTFANGNPGCEITCQYGCRECFSGGAGFIKGDGIFATFDGVTFDGNAVDVRFSYFDGVLQRGGAMAISGGNFSSVNFLKSIFKDNKAPFGGGLYAGEGTQVGLSDCTFSGNSAEAREGEGDDPETLPMIPLDQAGTRMGGAVLTDGDSLTVARSAFFKNQSRVGGAVAAQSGAVAIQNTSFFANHADLAGGSLAVPYNYQPYFYDYNDFNDFQNNREVSIGFLKYGRDALSASLNIQASLAVQDTKVSVTLQNATITLNTAGNSVGGSPLAQGGGVANLGPGAVYFKNTILSGNSLTSSGSGAECHGAFTSLGRNNIGNSSDGACVVVSEADAGADVSVDSGLKPCAEGLTTAGLGSCDPLEDSLMIGKATSCPAEDQHKAIRNPEKCTIGAIEGPEPAVLTGSVCGDGVVNEGEACDEGEAHNSDEPNATCRTDCTAQRCGDGIIDGAFDEGCDGGAACFECTAEVVPSTGCGITAEDLMDPSLKTNDDLVARFGFPAVEKCLQVFGGGSGCSLIRR